MFCPDCGREAIDCDLYCPICGYPLDLLEQKIEREKIEALGWAERIVGKPRIEEPPQSEESVISFVTGPHVPVEKDKKKGLFCDRCGSRIEVGVMCASCGDRLPFHADSDPFVSASLRGFIKLIFAPRSFAINFPYPVSGGIIQPILYPGVVASLFILSLPLARYEMVLRSDNSARIIVPVIAGFILSMILTPLLVYLSAGLIHGFAIVLGGKCQFRRTVRVFAAGIFWIFMLGLLYNLIKFGLFFIKPVLGDYIKQYYNPILMPIPMMSLWRPLFIAHLISIGWLFGWAYGGLYRLRWWNAVILTIAAYFPFIAPAWLYLLLLLPLRYSGLLP